MLQRIKSLLDRSMEPTKSKNLNQPKGDLEETRSIASSKESSEKMHDKYLSNDRLETEETDGGPILSFALHYKDRE